MTHAYVVGTCDTKRDELCYIRDVLRRAGVDAIVVDVGTSRRSTDADVAAADVAAYSPHGAESVWSDDRGTAVTRMSEALERYVVAHAHELGGIIGAGGSGGTALVAPAMRALPVGVPKVLVSTVASADVSPYVGPADITMMYSVTDIAGLNRISRRVLGNAANALAGMMQLPLAAPDSELPAVGLTMFGVTTPLVTHLAASLSGRYDPLVFHATGTGGRSMEKLVDSGALTAVLDMTTTEIADHIVGGIFSAGPERLDAIARTEVPYVGSVGAVDMVNFGPIDTVPERFATRLLHAHNPQITLMRTTADENVAIGRFIAEQLNRCRGPVRFLLPEGGVSLMDAPGQPFHDPDADGALFDTIEREVRPTTNRTVERVDASINDTRFAQRVLEHTSALLGEPLGDDR